MSALSIHKGFEHSEWGVGFLKSLESHGFIETKTPGSSVYFVENDSQGRETIETLRATGACTLLWFGQSFTKDDLLFALRNQVDSVLETSGVINETVKDAIGVISEKAKSQAERGRLLHSLKASLVGKQSVPVPEMKAVISKLEKSIEGEERTSESGLLFRQNQDLGEALILIHDWERTGVLVLTTESDIEMGQIDFLQGRIVGARTGKVSGLKAIYRMFLWENPLLNFSRVEPDNLEVVDSGMGGTLDQILEEGERQRTTRAEIQKDIPPPQIRLALDMESFKPGIHLSPDEFSVLSGIIEHGQVSQVVDYNDLPDVTIFQVLISLKRNSLIGVRHS